jgi:hypothetical protein
MALYQKIAVAPTHEPFVNLVDERAAYICCT